MKNILFYIVHYIIRDKFDSLFLNASNSGEENAIKHILNPENQMDTKNICSYLKDSFKIRENTFRNVVDLPQSGINFIYKINWLMYHVLFCCVDIGLRKPPYCHCIRLCFIQ